MISKLLYISLGIGKMNTFDLLSKIRAFQRKQFPLVETIEDHDIVIQVACVQESGHRLNIKSLLACDLGADPTIRRRLNRLVKFKVIAKVRSKEDKRCFDLEVARTVLQTYARLGSRLKGV